MPRHAEPSANNALAGILQRMLPSYDVRSENTRQIVDNPNLRPDILITDPGRSPHRRRRRLRYPEDAPDADDTQAAVRAASLSYAVLYDCDRFPQSGWLSGGVGELADFIRIVSVPQRIVEDATDALERGIACAAILDALGDSRPDAITDIASLLGRADISARGCQNPKSKGRGRLNCVPNPLDSRLRWNDGVKIGSNSAISASLRPLRLRAFAPLRQIPCVNTP